MLKVKRHHYITLRAKQKTHQKNNNHDFQSDINNLYNTHMLYVKKHDTDGNITI